MPRGKALRAYGQALDAYFARRFADAEKAFERVLGLDANDGAAKTMLARCARLQAEPPAEDWDGTHRMGNK